MITVIISIRDRSEDRLAACLRSVRNNTIGDHIEIVVSDFGSSNSAELEEVSRRFGAIYFYTESDVWNKAEALNIGYGIASNEIVISLDVDMVVSPETLQVVRDAILERPKACVVIQSRDLPEGISPNDLHLDDIDWTVLRHIARTRARWGVGGLFGCTKSIIRTVGGLDERMVGWGAEDLDFAKRCQHAGNPLIWLDEARAKIYHVWHPPTQDVAEATQESKALVDYNRNIYYSDDTVVRNSTTVPFVKGNPPLVSVVMCTFNRANLISESINSVLAQSVQDFEFIIVNDGSTDNTEEVVNSFTDPRIRLFSIENSGIAAARNFGALQARGRYIAVHDDDDLMLPDRLESSLAEMKAGVGAVYGALINFDNVSGKMNPYVAKEDFGAQTIPTMTAAPGHATWLIRSEIMKNLAYDTKQSSAVDNNLAIRMAAAGVKWKHTGKVHLMRRQHSGQITHSDFGVQNANARAGQSWYRSSGNADHRSASRERSKKATWPPMGKPEQIAMDSEAWLPDHLVSRNVIAFRPGEPSDSIWSTADQMRIWFGPKSGPGADRFKNSQVIVVNGAKWADLANLKANGYQFRLLDHTLKKPMSRAEAPQSFFAIGDRILQRLQRGRKTFDLLVAGEFDEGLGAENLVMGWNATDQAFTAEILSFDSKEDRKSYLDSSAIANSQSIVAFEIGEV